MGFGGYLCEVIATKTQPPVRRLKKTMTTDFARLIFILMLSLPTSSTVTSGQIHSFTHAMTAEVENKLTHDQLKTEEASSLNPLSEVSGHYIAQSTTADINPTEEKTTQASTKPSLQTTQTKTPNTFFPNLQKTETPTYNRSTVGMKSTTEVQFQVITSATTEATSQTSNQTSNSRVPPMLSSSTQSQDTSPSQFTSDRINHPSTHPTQSMDLNSTTTTSTTPVENKSTSASPVTGGDAMQSTGLYKTSMATTKTPFISRAKETGVEDKTGQDKKKTKNEINHGKVVAGLIGGALALMMVGFLVIYIKKRKLKRQQITTSDWAGPSPFLENAADNGQVTLRSSNRISLSSFLPQRLSKRLSLLPETDEELEDITPGTTFGDKHIGQKLDESDVQESNGTTVVVPEMKSTGDAQETVENSVSVSSSQTNDLLSTNNGEILSDHPAPPSVSGDVENAQGQVNDDPGQP